MSSCGGKWLFMFGAVISLCLLIDSGPSSLEGDRFVFLAALDVSVRVPEESVGTLSFSSPVLFVLLGDIVPILVFGCCYERLVYMRPRVNNNKSAIHLTSQTVLMILIIATTRRGEGFTLSSSETTPHFFHS